MKKTAVLMIIIMASILGSVAVAGDKGERKGGVLFLFQKCDDSLMDAEGYDPLGCPLLGNGPWPIFFENSRWGQMHYNLVGDTFKFSFQGKRLLPESDYSLIYYPDPWPGNGLICLGTGMTNPAGNLQIHGEREIPSGLPADYDANYNPIDPSGAVGAKIWLVLSEDAQCETETGAIDGTMLGWNPTAYLFEGNLIVYQYTGLGLDGGSGEDTETEVMEDGFETTSETNADQGGRRGKGTGRDKDKNR